MPIIFVEVLFCSFFSEKKIVEKIDSTLKVNLALFTRESIKYIGPIIYTYIVLTVTERGNEVQRKYLDSVIVERTTKFINQFWIGHDIQDLMDL